MKGGRYVVDASVAIKLFIDEPLSEQAEVLFSTPQAEPAGEFHVPDLFYIECTNVLWKLPQQLNAAGALIVVDYGHPPTPDEVRPERVAYALRDVLEIEGVGAPAAARPLSEPMAPAVATGVTLLSVEAQPSRVPRGQPLNLTVHFEVTGATTGQPLSLIINRQLYQGETPLFSGPRTQQGHWAAGVHSAEFTLTVPATTTPGVYRFKAWLSHDGKEETREALFEVLEGGG